MMQRINKNVERKSGSNIMDKSPTPTVGCKRLLGNDPIMMIEDIWMTVDQELDSGRYQYFGTAKTHKDDDEPYILKDSTHSQSCKRSGIRAPTQTGC